jgi:hypothetical protein
MPEVASVAWMSNLTGRLNQSPTVSAAAQAWRPSEPARSGSYLSPYPNGLLRLPARSWHVPVTDAAVPSGPHGVLAGWLRAAFPCNLVHLGRNCETVPKKS